MATATMSTTGGKTTNPMTTAPQVDKQDYFWYPAENNWKDCIKKMESALKRVELDFSGQWREEERQVQERKVASLGKKTTKTEVEKVVDLYEDYHFRPDGNAWVQGGKIDEISDIASMPATWPRLCTSSQAPPFPIPTPYDPNPRSGRVYQGVLQDFYLVQALHAVGQRSGLIRDVFCNLEFSRPHLGCFVLRFYKHAQWQHIEIDDFLPCDKEENPLCITSEFYPNLAWPSLIQKAYAKLHGSWEGLSDGGHIEEAMTDLTGGLSGRFYTNDIAGDRLWFYLHELMNTCVFGCNINVGECSKRNVAIEGHWAAAIHDVAKVDGIPFVCVSTTAPHSVCRHLPQLHNVPGGYGPSDGFAWMRIDDFHQFFDIIYECRLVNTDLGGPHEGIYYTPGYIPDSPLYEAIWAYQGTVVSENAPSFLIEVNDGQAPCVIMLDVSQTDMRYFQKGRQPQAPLLLRFFQCSDLVDETRGGEVFMVHMSAWGHCRDACTTVKVFRPGKYLAMVSLPHKYRCKRMIFRTYSTEKIIIKPVTAHRDFINVIPEGPLGAVPYSFTGFVRIDNVVEKLPMMFDENDGKGKPLAGSPKSRKLASDPHHMQGMRGPKAVGKFGGKDSYTTVDASERQKSNCSVM